LGLYSGWSIFISMSIKRKLKSLLIENDINTSLRRIGDQVASKLKCDSRGSCIHFAELFIQEVEKINPDLLNHFNVIEGYVSELDYPQEHTWIELPNGDTIDPTIAQFGKDHEGHTDRIVYRGTGMDYLTNYMAHDDTYEKERENFPTKYFK